MPEPDNLDLPPIIPPLLPGDTEPPSSLPRGPWGFWPTTGWGAIIAFVYLAVQTLVTVVYLAADFVAHQGKPSLSIETIGSDGLLLGTAVILCAPPVTALCLLFAKLRKGPSIRDYLGLNWPTVKAFAGWMLALIALGIANDFLTVYLERPHVPEVMINIYTNTAFKPVIWVGIVLAAPLTEEFLFRGFLFRGWKESCLGGAGTVLLTALLWALIHVQYDAYNIFIIFIVGIMLGIARLKTGSMLLCLMLHAIINLIATIQLEFLLKN